jgi:flagellar basal-body rod modification protein FlgD
MATSSITDVTQKAISYYENPKSSSSSSEISDNFMTLMLAQLKNQNPMQPADDSQLLSQMAELNSLTTLQAISKQMSELATASQSSYGASLIGKNIVSTDANGNTTQGVVTSMEYSGGTYTLSIGDSSVDLSTITKVMEA